MANRYGISMVIWLELFIVIIAYRKDDIMPLKSGNHNKKNESSFTVLGIG